MIPRIIQRLLEHARVMPQAPALVQVQKGVPKNPGEPTSGVKQRLFPSSGTPGEGQGGGLGPHKEPGRLVERNPPPLSSPGVPGEEVRAPTILGTSIQSGQTWSWSQLEIASRILAVQLACDAPHGGTALLCCANEPAFVVAMLGIIRAGMNALPLAPDSKSELSDAAAQSRAVAIVGGRAALDAVPWLAVPIHLENVRKMRDQTPTWDPSVAGGDLLLRTSGTTGEPKIVSRNSASLDAVSEAMCEAIGFGPDDRVLAAVPLCHSYGIEHGLLAPIWAGSCTHLCDGFDLPVILRQLNDPITIFPGVPFMFDALAQTPGEQTFPKLRRAYSAGGPLPPAVAQAFARRYGVEVGQVYGATELGSVTFGYTGVGRPLRDVSIRVEADSGEIAIAAPSMFDGYLNDPAETAVRMSDGYFRTGDLGSIDASGNLILTGRAKLLIDIGGRKVNPLEVEAVLEEHPAVAQAIVAPMTLSGTITRLKAIVVPRAGAAAPSAAQLRQFVKERLSPYKVPRVFEIRDSLPRSASGKVLRQQLQE